MKDFILRTKKEKADIDARLLKLDTFLKQDDTFEKIGEYQYNMLHMQLDAMCIYSGILYLRLKDLENDEN